jgi:hypothetical protein
VNWARYANPTALPTLAEIEQVLTSLRVNTGGRGTRKKIAPNWEVGFFENSDRDTRAERPFVATFTYALGRTSTARLKRDEVFTKTRFAKWQRDAVWRLKPETVQRLSRDIERIMSDPRAK